ncbi:MAG: PAS domain-containing sensor histidine kinase, partial [Panacibacter sp.]
LCITGIIISSIPAFYQGFVTSSGYTISNHLVAIFEYLFTSFIVLYIKKEIRYNNTRKQYYSSLFEYATEAILLVNSKTKIVFVNPATTKMFGYASTELAGVLLDTLIPQRFHESHKHYQQDYFHHPVSKQMGIGRDLYAVKKNGKEFPVEVSLSHFVENGNKFVIAFVVDITKRKEFERRILQQSAELEKKVEERTLVLKEALGKLEQSQNELKESLEKEKELNDIKSRFVSMASHEFRTPLSTVLSSAELIEKYEKAEEQDKRNRHINKIKNSVTQLNGILEDFLSLGKLDEGRITTEKTTFNLENLLQSVKEEMEPLKKNGQQIMLEYNGASSVFSDKKLLRNILINLLGNAIKYSDENMHVWLKASCTGHTVTITIKDEGIGISKEDQEHLFTTFFRGRNAANIQGTGLGLHIVKRYADLIEADIELKSNLNKGTTVAIRFTENNLITANE